MAKVGKKQPKISHSATGHAHCVLTCPACAQQALREMSTAELLTLAPWISQPLSIYWYFIDSACVGLTLLGKRPTAVFFLCSACYFVDVVWVKTPEALRSIRRIARRELAKLYSLPGSGDDKDRMAAQYYKDLSPEWQRVVPASWWQSSNVMREIETRRD